MTKQTFTVNIRADGVRETLAAFRRLPREANDALRDRSMELAESLVGRARFAAYASPTPQAALIASTIKAQRDRVPVIKAGGTTRVGRNRVPAWKVLFGAEFGSNAYPQFGHPHTGREGIWFFPLVERHGEEIMRAWLRTADDIVSSFSNERGVG